jgi:hypothetical protein
MPLAKLRAGSEERRSLDIGTHAVSELHCAVAAGAGECVDPTLKVGDAGRRDCAAHVLGIRAPPRRS